MPGAVAACKKAIELDPKSAAAHTNLGVALRDSKDVAGAIAACKKAIELDPKCVAAHNNLGSRLRDGKDLPAAVAAYKKAIELDPKSVEAHINLGLGAAGKQGPAGGRRRLQEGHRTRPEATPRLTPTWAASCFFRETRRGPSPR